MFGLVIILAVGVGAVENDQWDPIRDQLQDFKDKTMGPVGVLTTNNGAPVSLAEATSSLNSRLINHEHLMDGFTSLVREVIPERIAHAKGTGAFGYFEVTHDISHICRAAFLNKVGKQTPVAVRFATSSRDRGSSDLNREPRGFAVKFYTEEGNFDIPGFSTPVYFYKDPLHFITLVHAIGRNPATGVHDTTMLLDAVQLVPESMFLFLLIFSDRGLPASYRNMPGFGIHTYQVENESRVPSYVKFHITPDAGIKNLGVEEARNVSSDLDYLIKDFYGAIAKGDFPSWTVSAQILTKSDVDKMGPRAFDITRLVSLKKFPLHPFGKITLNRNAKNYFAEIEQLAFSPSNLVPGVQGAPDKVFEARRLAYRDAQLFRLGGNFKKIPVNCPYQTRTFTYNRDGRAPVGNNGEDAPNYYPNSFNGPAPSMAKPSSRLIDIVESNGVDNFDQAADFYANEIPPAERDRLIGNLALWIKPAVKDIQKKMLELFTTIHPDLGKRVEQSLNASMSN
ncbi:catalase-like [Maniola hyperantus]|uniref:catalase-like n=1 Tax=Aphantopus hyperantus TaxID=2795564 RepID=UPI0021443831